MIELTRQQMILIREKSLRKMRKSKLSMKKIAKICGVSSSLIDRRLKEYGIE